LYDLTINELNLIKSIEKFMHHEEWHADISITEELIKNCLQTQFPVLEPLEIQFLGEGWDNKAFLINQKIIFRFPRRKVAAELIQQENKLLNNLPIFDNIKIPLPEYIGEPTLQYPYVFQGYPIIEGISGYQALLSQSERAASLSVVSNFLRKLHDVDKEQAIAIGALEQESNRTIIDNSIDKLCERIDKIVERQICLINQTVFHAEVDAVRNLVLSKNDTCLVHGDLDCRHLIFNQHQLMGIIDWGDAGIANKAVDLSIIWSFYPQDCHEKFFEIYGVVEAATWQYARFLALYSAFTLMFYGKEIGDELLFAESFNAIKNINPDLLIDCNVNKIAS
jgi:aminoglycoside phosphotransferase (APT) family kinase protein